LYTYHSKELSINCDEYIDICRLRYQSFFNLYLNDKQDLVEEIAGIPSLKPCKYDKHSAIFAVYKNKECIGSIRLIIRDSRQNNFLEIEESAINKLGSFIQDDLKIAEVGRLVVDKKYRREICVVFMLFNCITQYSLKNQLDYLVCEAPAHNSKHYVRLGFEVVDENIGWPVNKQILVNHLVFDIRRNRVRARFYGYIMSLLARNPYLYKVFFN
jgi:hypothetical protein